MSPMSRPSKVDGLRRGIGTAGDPRTVPPAAGDPTAPEGTTAPQPAAAAKPARITLNLPPELYRELNRWTGTAADAIDVPRVGVQEALRAMVRVVTAGQARNAEQQIFAAIREELGR